MTATEIPQTRRWWARLAVALALAAALVLIVFAGAMGTFFLLVTTCVGVAVAVAALYNSLLHRQIVRWVLLGIAVAAPIVVLVQFARRDLLWVVIVAYVLASLSAVCARAALRPERLGAMPEYDVPPPRRPVLLMNPRSGGGKVERFDLVRKAERLGARVVLLDGPGMVDVEALARKAVADGADLLGVAGGDGTQALVAGVAAEHDLPFLVISAGTRNHFALDLGLDRTDPATCLDGLSDGVELRVDIGRLDERTFVNNASFGVYAEIVQSPAYRDEKRGTVLRMLPELLSGRRGARLAAHIDGTPSPGPQAVLISNNPYGTNDLTGLGRRARLDRGRLGVVTISVRSTRQAVGLLYRAHDHGLVRHTATEVVIDADTPTVPVGVDGESLVVPTPVRCTVQPGALRVRVPRNRPGVRPASPALDVSRLYHLALPGRRGEVYEHTSRTLQR